MRFLSTTLASIHHALIPIFIAICMTADDKTFSKFYFVSGCQLCFRHVVSTNTPILLRLPDAMQVKPLATDLDQNVAVNKRSDGFTPKNIEYTARKLKTFTPRRRRINQPLYMIIEKDNDHGTSSSSSDIETSNNQSSDNNQTEFDAIKFFGDLERSGDDAGETEQEQLEGAMSMVMIGAIGFYKKVISPLLPPACRFVPTCSTYGVQAIQEFGPTKGCLLIAWRILRCTPMGGKGYDPPKWPPVFYSYSSY